MHVLLCLDVFDEMFLLTGREMNTQTAAVFAIDEKLSPIILYIIKTSADTFPAL